MEIEVEPEKVVLIKFGVAMVVGLAIVFILLYVVLPAITAKPPAPKYDYNAQMDFLKWSICERQDAIQMYIQNPVSDHPQVLKLLTDVAIYDNMAMQMGLKNFSVSSCQRQ